MAQLLFFGIIGIILNRKSNFEQEYSFLELHGLRKNYGKIRKPEGRGENKKHKNKT
jgi:hypothetical protein